MKRKYVLCERAPHGCPSPRSTQVDSTVTPSYRLCNEAKLFMNWFNSFNHVSCLVRFQRCIAWDFRVPDICMDLRECVRVCGQLS